MAVQQFEAGNMRGQNGATPYIDPVSKHWIIEGIDTGTVAQGTNGTNGTNGLNGTNGVDGVSPHIDQGTGHWFIGSTDTGITAAGSTGPAGSITVKQTITGAPGSNAQVIVDGTPQAAELTFVIPRGDTGQNGSNASDHATLSNRSTPDQHPTMAITGLDTSLTNITNKNAAIEASLNTHVSNKQNPHEVSLQQAASVQGSTQARVPQLFEGGFAQDNKLITRAEARAMVIGGENYRGSFKFAVDERVSLSTIPTTNPQDGRPWAASGDKCFVADENALLSYNGSGWVDVQFDTPAEGDIYNILFYFGDWNSIVYVGQVTAEIICNDSGLPAFGMVVYTNQMMDGSVTDQKIGTRTLADNAGVTTPPDVSQPKSLTSWLQSIRDSIKGAFAQIASIVNTDLPDIRNTKANKSEVQIKGVSGAAYNVYSQADVDAIPKDTGGNVDIFVRANFEIRIEGFVRDNLAVVFVSNASIGTIINCINVTLYIVDNSVVTIREGTVPWRNSSVSFHESNLGPSGYYDVLGDFSRNGMILRLSGTARFNGSFGIRDSSSLYIGDFANAGGDLTVYVGYGDVTVGDNVNTNNVHFIAGDGFIRRVILNSSDIPETYVRKSLLNNYPTKQEVVLNRANATTWNVYNQSQIDAIPRHGVDVSINIMASFDVDISFFYGGVLRITFFANCPSLTFGYNYNRTVIESNGYDVTFFSGEQRNAGYILLRGNAGGKYIFNTTFVGLSDIRIQNVGNYSLSGTIYASHGTVFVVDKNNNPSNVLYIYSEYGSMVSIIDMATGFNFVNNGDGFIIDNRPGRPMETFVRKV